MIPGCADALRPVKQRHPGEVLPGLYQQARLWGCPDPIRAKPGGAWDTPAHRTRDLAGTLQERHCRMEAASDSWQPGGGGVGG